MLVFGCGLLVVGWLARKISINKNKQIYISLFLYYFYLLIFYIANKKNGQRKSIFLY